MKCTRLILGAVLVTGISGVALGETPKYPPLAPLSSVPIPVDNPQTLEKVELGKKLFWDLQTNLN